VYLVYLANNTLFGMLDQTWTDTDETPNYLVIVYKAHER
jgi:alpha-amylase/alpha-mannosidase (GH57 family)